MVTKFSGKKKSKISIDLEERAIPILIVILIVIIAVSFLCGYLVGYQINRMNNVSEPTTDLLAKPNNLVNPEAIETPVVKTLPPKQNVNVKPAEVKSTKKTYFYTLQIYSSENKNKAVTRMNILKKRGFSVYLTSTKMPNGTWYLVRMGKFDSVDSAKKLGKKFEEQGIIPKYKVVKDYD
jgi:cell division septation protein DedD